MKKVAISIGHNPVRPGFQVRKFSEYSEMAPVAGLLVRELMYVGVIAIMAGTGPSRSKVSYINEVAPDLAVELHLNSGGGQGCETLYCPHSRKGKTAAAIIHEEIKSINKRDRGIKPGWYLQDYKRGPIYFLKKTNCPAIITETYFMDNEDAVNNFAGNLLFYTELAKKLAAGIKNYLEV
jgi:N-acetylmuramoyl-L-alanine amidase